MTAQGKNSDNGVVSLTSSHSFTETVSQLLAGFADHGIKVFAVIDQQAEAMAVGLAMQPMTMILFGNPKGGTSLMVAQPEAGLDLPLKLLVSESASGQVSVIFNAAAYVIKRHGLAPEMEGNLSPAERLIAKVVGA